MYESSKKFSSFVFLMVFDGRFDEKEHDLLIWFRSNGLFSFDMVWKSVDKYLLQGFVYISINESRLSEIIT